MAISQTKVVFVLLLLCMCASAALCQRNDEVVSSLAIEKRLPSFDLNHETLFDGLAKLESETTLGFSIERIVPKDQHSAAVEVPEFTASKRDISIREALDWLCSLDPRYEWSEDHGMVNVFPRAVAKDPNYPMNRRVGQLEIRSDSPFEAVFEASRSLPPPAIPLGSLSFGIQQNYPKKMTFDFSGKSIREIANTAAHTMGNSWGWELTGWEGYRLLFFHVHLLTRSQAQMSRDAVSTAK